MYKLKTKFISIGRVGTVAVNQSMLRHPNIELQPWIEDRKFILKQGFLGELKTNAHENLTVHHQELFTAQNQQRLEEVTTLQSHKLIHQVRDPMSHVVGWYNHIAESFHLKENGWHDPVDMDTFINASNIIFPTLYNEQIARRFYPYADEVKLVEFNQLKSEQFNHTLSSLYRFLEIPEQATTYTEIQNDLTTKLCKRGITMTLNGESVKFTLVQQSSISERDSENYFYKVDTLGETMQKNCPDARAVSGTIYIGFESGKALKKSSYDLINAHKQEIFTPALEMWAKNVQKVSSELQGKKVTQLNPKQLDKLWKLVGEDTKAFAQRYPQLKDHWQML